MSSEFVGVGAVDILYCLLYGHGLVVPYSDAPVVVTVYEVALVE